MPDERVGCAMGDSTAHVGRGGPVHRILIVEPLPTFRRALCETFTRNGHLAWTAGDFQQAVDWIMRGRPLDAALLNWQVQGGTGVDVARLLKLVRPQPVVRLMSADPNACMATEALDNGLLVRPVTWGAQRLALDLVSALRSHLAGNAASPDLCSWS